jgi:hypothetical protein
MTPVVEVTGAGVTVPEYPSSSFRLVPPMQAGAEHLHTVTLSYPCSVLKVVNVRVVVVALGGAMIPDMISEFP